MLLAIKDMMHLITFKHCERGVWVLVSEVDAFKQTVGHGKSIRLFGC